MYYDFSEKALPDIYIRQGRECYLDPVRKKLIYITPEETVRQRIIAYLLEEALVPVQMMGVEEHLSHYGINSTRRADIIVKAVSKDGMIYPVAVIECKAPQVGISEKALDQMLYYSEALGCDYAVATNGSMLFVYHYDKERCEYIQIKGIPCYDDMLSGDFVEFVPEEKPERIPFDKISEFVESLDETSPDISNQTEHSLACAAFNLEECFLDTSYRMPEKRYGIFRLIEDYGVRMLSYGNAGGGTFFGPYRSFLVEIDGSCEFVSLGFAVYGRNENPDVWKTALVVAIDSEKEAHHSLQLSIDDNVLHEGNRFTFLHHGRIAVGNMGSGKISELRSFVRERYPKILCGDKFNLGSLVYDRLWTLEDSEIQALTENLISYALIRDEYRRKVKNG